MTERARNDYLYLNDRWLFCDDVIAAHRIAYGNIQVGGYPALLHPVIAVCVTENVQPRMDLVVFTQARRFSALSETKKKAAQKTWQRGAMSFWLCGVELHHTVGHSLW